MTTCAVRVDRQYSDSPSAAMYNMALIDTVTVTLLDVRIIKTAFNEIKYGYLILIPTVVLRGLHNEVYSFT